jgi:Zn-finger nucleic acid-binding protein
MTCANYNLDPTTVDRQNIDIEYCTDCDAVWMEPKEMDSLLQKMLSNKLTAPEPRRVQTPSISPTSEESLTETGSDYDTYFAYKYHGSYGFPTPSNARAQHLLEKR